MRRSWCLWSAVVLGLLSAGLVQSGDADKARAIVDRAIKAVGGEDLVKKHQAATFKEKGMYYGMGDGLPYTGNYAFQWPNKFRMEIEGVFIIVVDGDKGWMKAGDTREMSKEELTQQRYDRKAGYITTLLPLKNKAFQLSVLDEAQVDSKAAQVVKVSRQDFPEVKLFFDKDSGRLVKSEYRTKAQEEANKEVAQEAFYQGYRDVEGLQVPAKLVIKRDGKLYIEAENFDVKSHGKLDAKVFAMP